MYRGFVPRHARITVTGTTLEGEEVKLRLKGLPAICFQHEIDHLNGIMFYDHINQQDPFATPENAIAIGGRVIKEKLAKISLPTRCRGRLVYLSLIG